MSLWASFEQILDLILKEYCNILGVLKTPNPLTSEVPTESGEAKEIKKHYSSAPKFHLNICTKEKKANWDALEVLLTNTLDLLRWSL